MNQQQSLRLLAAGGDLRQLTAASELARQHSVTITGFDRFGTVPEGVTSAAHIHDLPAQLDALLLPMPVTHDGGFLHTPFGSNAVRLSALLPFVRPGGMVFGGRITAQEHGLLESAGCDQLLNLLSA